MREWRNYIRNPPEWHRWKVIEWLRSEGDRYFDGSEEIHVMNAEQARADPAWNVAGVWWRPVL